MNGFLQRGENVVENSEYITTLSLLEISYADTCMLSIPNNTYVYLYGEDRNKVGEVNFTGNYDLSSVIERNNAKYIRICSKISNPSNVVNIGISAGFNVISFVVQ